ncbi:MAG: helix-turn-helix domain-containing protein [Oligoflexales bacterium]
MNRIRKEQKLTQEQLGQMTGTSTMTVKRLESATASTGLEKLIAITDVLGVSLADLFRELEFGNENLLAKVDPKIAGEPNKLNKLAPTEKEWFSDIIGENSRESLGS